MQGIIDCKGTETRQIFFTYVCNGKKIKELFASTLNEITASVICVSSIMTVLNPKLTKDNGKQKSPKRVPFFAS